MSLTTGCKILALLLILFTQVEWGHRDKGRLQTPAEHAISSPLCPLPLDTSLPGEQDSEQNAVAAVDPPDLAHSLSFSGYPRLINDLDSQPSLFFEIFHPPEVPAS